MKICGCGCGHRGPAKIQRKNILSNLKELNIEYKKAKSSFIAASEFKPTGKGIKAAKKEKWENAKNKYVHYYDSVYADDIDALAEQGEIYSHLGQLADTSEDANKCYEEAIEKFREADSKGQNNPFHQIRIAENWIKKRNHKKAFETYWKILYELDKPTDEENLTCLINAGILAIRIAGEGDKKYATEKLKKIIASMKEYHRREEILPTFESRLKEIVEDLEPGKIKKPIITKGTAKNLQWQAQWNGVLLLLLTLDGATESQIKERWLDNLSTTKLIVATMMDVGRDTSVYSGVTRRGNFASEYGPGPTPPGIESIIEETRSFGTNGYKLTKTGKEEAERIQKLVEKAMKDPEIKLEKNYGPGITSKLVDRYRKWQA